MPGAAQAALAIREALAGTACDTACPVSARMSLTVGDVVVGRVGSVVRHAVAVVGPSLGTGTRLLKQAHPGSIIVTGEVVEALRTEAPALAERFRLVKPAFAVPATDGIVVATYAID